ncbi:hypothetical protein HPB51_010010 [Rhipicephalus microplus]|uniref:Uncharacterized protein n=1 Tax=Rhipicephalus microplus TaxID=6941 RepID=A0A9J6DME8_RHIMP|nr:hypothetical protein HPB51_010010 [Rhipicephalus microplus]
MGGPSPREETTATEHAASHKDTRKFVTTAAASAIVQTFALILTQRGAESADSKPHPKTTNVSPTAPSAVDHTPLPIRTVNVNFKFRTSYANDDADAVDAVVAAPEDRVEPAPAIPAPPRAPMRHPGEAAPSHRQRDVAVPSAATPAPGDTPHLARLS